jgi:hypothetical protein
MKTRFGRTLLCLLMVAFSATPLLAQASAAKEGQLALRYDVDSATLTYCRMAGKNGSPFDDPIVVNPRIKTTGTSATVTEFTASTNPFNLVSVGDVLVISTPTATDAEAKTSAVVIAKASAASITVDPAVTLTGATGHLFGFYKIACGTTAADGWVAIPPATAQLGLLMQYDQGDLTALVVRWECKGVDPFAEVVILYPGESSDCGIGGTLSTDRCSYATAGVTSRLEVVDEAPTFSFCRVGLAWTGADASDAGANLERVTVKAILR